MVLCVLSMGVVAGPLDKAFAALEVHDYFKAKKLFEKQTKRHPAAAWYGLSVITGRADNPFYQPDSSHAAIQRSRAAFQALSLREKDKIAKLGVDSAAIHEQFVLVSGIAWQKVLATDRLSEYDRFIKQYAGSNLVAQAEDRRNELAFEEARRLNTASAYKDFLARYPEAKEAYGARSRLQEAIYREATTNGTVREYEAFIKDHPQNSHVRDAHDMLLKLNVPNGTPAEFAAFIRRYPESPNVAAAWRSMYDSYTKELSVENITRFLKDYPDYPYINELMTDYKVASLVLYPFRQDGHWGYIDASGVERIKAEFDFAEPFGHAQAQVGLHGRSGTINKLGKPVIPIIHDDVLDFREGMATVELNGMQGACDRNGRLLVRIEYEEVGEYDHGMAAASKQGKYGYIDEEGEVVVPFIFDGAMRFSNGRAVVTKDDQSGVIDMKGEMVVPFQYDWVEGFQASPLSRVRKAGRMGLIDRFGDAVLAVEHDHVGSLYDGLALVIDKGKAGYVDASGNWRIPQRYDANALTINMGDFHNGLARVLSGAKLGMVDTAGNRVIQPQYADIGLLEGGLIPVKRTSKWGYIKPSMANVVDAKYDQAWAFHQGYARVQLGGLYGLVDSLGTEVIKPRFTALSDLAKGLWAASDEQGMGVVDHAGEVRIPLAFDQVTLVDKGLVKVTRGNKFAYLRLADGSVLWKERGFDAGSTD